MSDVHPLKHLNIKVHGRVQGVGFRYEAKKCARMLSIAGFIRNEPDGSVYIEAEGDEDALKKLVVWCRRGPESAEVKRVEEDWTAPLKSFNSFLIA
jgi:acylphosphatase